MGDWQVRRATAGDVADIMRLERGPGYEALVNRWAEGEHCGALSDPRFAYFLGLADGVPVGFALLRGWRAPDRVTYLKRIAVAQPGAGTGRRLLGEVVDRVFSETDAWRFWLGVFTDNLRAQSAYRAVGFRPEGVTRGSAYFGGENRDETIMSMLRPEWQASTRALHCGEARS
jgi:RimJ/RimL family protein N-acetyltransferase